MLEIKTRNQLRALAHSLKPVVSIGKKGLSDSLISEIGMALLAHELIKIQVQKSAIEECEETLSQICIALNAQLVELRGHVATLFKPHPENPKIKIK